MDRPETIFIPTGLVRSPSVCFRVGRAMLAYGCFEGDQVTTVHRGMGILEASQEYDNEDLVMLALHLAMECPDRVGHVWGMVDAIEGDVRWRLMKQDDDPDGRFRVIPVPLS
jgi:hypothetical protein